MNRRELFEEICRKRTFLCVGLDTDPNKIPSHLRSSDQAILDFNKAIIDATQDLCVAYKINLAFYEALGVKGWEVLESTLQYIPKEQFVIADAKRGDIGNTSRMYAKAFYDTYNFDAVTVAPYMGSDSVQPFLEWEDKWVILLALTSNKGSEDFQFIESADGSMLYENVLSKSALWGSTDNLMYVVGATHPESFSDIRKLVPNHFLLVPGVGAQGGDLEKVCEFGINNHCGLLINSSRGIIYAGSGEDYADISREKAKELQRKMESILVNYSLI